MENSEKIISIDISSNKVKVGLISNQLKLEASTFQYYNTINDDIDGFAKRFDMDDIWNKIQIGIKFVLKEKKPDNIMGITSCGQRIAVVFIDKQGNEIYGGPNRDVRGIDSAYLIEDAFSEEDLFHITGHSPSLMFALARLLWFKEEEEDLYEEINKVLMLDDWIGYKLSGECYSDYTSVGASQLFDVKKRTWSSEIIETFNLNPDLFPEIIESGTVIGNLRPEIRDEFGLKKMNIPIIKGCGDTQANLLGMGVIEDGNVGISLGTTAPIHLVVNEPIIDPKLNFWTECHAIKDKWLIEANTGGTGIVYDWFKDAFLQDPNADQAMESYLKKVKPGANSTYAYLGPEFMAIKDQTSIKRSVFIFQPPSMIGEELPRIENFARSAIENICFGIHENFQQLKEFAKTNIKASCSGGMSKSREFCKILTNILNTELNVPEIKDSAFIGTAINALIGLKRYSDYDSIIKKLIKFDTYSLDSTISEQYKTIYTEWKNLKKKIDDL